MPDVAGKGSAAGGELAIVLHTHMPYVEGFGTWPFGEEWLWEAIATCYLPVLELLDRGAPLTLSLTPVLCDQLEQKGLFERFERFVVDVRRESHRRDIEGLSADGNDGLARELERSLSDYEWARERLGERGGDLLAALAPHAQWTSCATHAVLPLLATDPGLRLQLQAGIDAHRARFGEGWRGGFWLPECAHAPWLDVALEDAGVHATCVELTDRFGLGAAEHLRPRRSEAGVVLVPIDRATVDLVWGAQGYPSHGRYRDYHRHTVHHHNPWGNDGEPYDHERALALAREHAVDFVTSVAQRLRNGGLAVCALDTELLGHWWYEGVVWLEAVVQECARAGVALTRLDDALERHQPVASGDETWSVTSWGNGADLSTWSGPAVADLAFSARAAELRVVAAGTRAGQAAVRELLALQASDWAFMVSRGLAVPYARERAEGHRRALSAALSADAGDGAGDVAGLRNLAVHANRSLLLAP